MKLASFRSVTLLAAAVLFTANVAVASAETRPCGIGEPIAIDGKKANVPSLMRRQSSSSSDRCGPSFGGSSCRTGQCCSRYGWCGTSSQHCAAGCLSKFGRCGEAGRSAVAEKEAKKSGLVFTTCRVPRSFAITFDDGPGKLFDHVLATLNRLHVKATFFVNGNNVANLNQAADAQKVLRAYRSGHQIASHTYSHADLDQMDDAGIRTEMNRLDNQLRRIIGQRPVYMRPPYGNANEDTQRTLNRLGYRIVNWNVDTLDWQHPNDARASLQAYAEALDEAGSDSQASFISLQHDIQPSTASGLIEDAVNLVRRRGFRLMRVDECMGDADGAYRD